MVKVLNEGIISGSSSVADFDEYVALLVSALTAVLASQDSQSSRETLPRGTEFLDAETGAKKIGLRDRKCHQRPKARNDIGEARPEICNLEGLDGGDGRDRTATSPPSHRTCL
jgi:hypothetical protein